MAWKTTSGHEARTKTRPQYRPASCVGRWSSLTLRGAVASRRLRSRGSDAIPAYSWVCQSASLAGRDATFVTTHRPRLALRESDRRRTRLDGTDAAATVTVAPDRTRVVEEASASVAVSRLPNATSSTAPSRVRGTCVGGHRRDDERYGEEKSNGGRELRTDQSRGRLTEEAEKAQGNGGDAEEKRDAGEGRSRGGGTDFVGRSGESTADSLRA